jgi:predicted TIM-barrel fold metal-dependent hydrolase
MSIIDAHVHVDDEEAAERLDELRGDGLVGVVAHLPAGVSEPEWAPSNARWCAGVGAEPDTLALARALAARTVGCVKIYLGYVPRWATDPAYEPVYGLAARYGVPVVFHTGDTSSPDARLKYADPLTVDDVAVDHRDVTFVIAHCGNPWLQSAAEVAYKNPNVVLECSALMTGNVDELDPEIRERYVVDAIRWVFGYLEDPTKLMFGTDWPLVERAPYVRAYREAIPPEHWNAVFFGNAARVFGF